MNNRLWNVKNPHQTNAERVLCVCSAALLRSPTCANTLHKEYGLNTRAVGLETSFALIPIDEALLEWADTVIVMEYGQAEGVDRLCEKYGINTSDIYNFSIPDEYEWGDSDLIELIKQRWTHKEMYAWN